MSGVSLYQQLLEDDFEKLHPALQAFHRAGHGRGGGTFTVVRPPGPAALLAWWMGMPRPGRDVPLDLEVEAVGAREVWRRQFGRQPMVTTQRVWRGMLLEAAGPVEIALDVRVRHGGMTMRSRRAFLAGLPLPRWLTPRIAVVVLPDADGWRVRVRVGLPLAGEVTRYEGQVQIQQCHLASAPSASPFSTSKK